MEYLACFKQPISFRFAISHPAAPRSQKPIGPQFRDFSPCGSRSAISFSSQLYSLLRPAPKWLKGFRFAISLPGVSRSGEPIASGSRFWLRCSLVLRAHGIQVRDFSPCSSQVPETSGSRKVSRKTHYPGNLSLCNLQGLAKKRPSWQPAACYWACSQHV